MNETPQYFFSLIQLNDFVILILVQTKTEISELLRCLQVLSFSELFAVLGMRKTQIPE